MRASLEWSDQQLISICAFPVGLNRATARLVGRAVADVFDCSLVTMSDTIAVLQKLGIVIELLGFEACRELTSPNRMPQLEELGQACFLG
jgi:hypothetical protein